MGNAQSSPDARPKIAKPKTNTNARSSKSLSPPGSLSDALKAASSTTLDSCPYHDIPSIVASPTSNGPAEDAHAHALRPQSLSSPLSPADSSHRIREQPTMDSLAGSVVRALSRRNSKSATTISARSSAAQLHNGSQLSMVTEKPIDLQSAIAILQELRKTASPEDMAALHKALMPMGSRDSLAQYTDSEPPEDLDPSTAAVIRRRSFAQPGVATRFSLGKSDRAVLRKAVPAPTAQPRQSWTKDMMGASPLARLSSLDLMEPPSEILENRAQTPSELDYSQLGNLKHGSLQVVNGCPSPIPSIASPGRAGRTVSDERDENYFTASERGDDSRPGSKQTPTLPQETWNAPVPVDPTPRGRGRILDYTPQPRETSPLKQEVRIASLDASHDIDAESVYSRQLDREQSVHSKSGRRFSFEETPEPTVPPVPLRLPQAAQSAVSLANDYMAEMPPSPHKSARDVAEPVDVPRLEDVVARPMSAIRSPDQPPKLPAVEDVVRPPMSPFSDEREQIVILPPRNTQDPLPISPRRPLDSHPAPSRPSLDLPALPNQKPRRPIGVKADSGYGSNASARNSTSEHTSPVEARPNLATQGYITPALSAPPRPAAHRMYSGKGLADLSARIGNIGNKNDTQHVTQPDGEDDIVQSIETDPMPQMDRRKSWRKSVRKSLPRLMSAESAASVFSKSTSAISDTTSPSVDKPQLKKLQKKRPLSQPPINMSDRHVLEGGVPRVPSSVFSRYSNRLSATPDMQHLDQTYDMGVDSRETSLEPSVAAAASKSSLPSCFFPDANLDSEEEGPPPPTHRRMSFGKHSFRRSLSRSRSKSRVNEQEVHSNGIADFGTVRQSLGTSPYDAAMPAMPRRQSVGAQAHTQPHHLGSNGNGGWSGPREGWDDQTALRIAQTRSRERASQLYAEQMERERFERAREGERRPAMPVRPVTYHEDMPSLQIYRPATGVPMPLPMNRPKSAVPARDNQLRHGASWYDDEEARSSQESKRASSRPRTAHATTHQQSRDASPVKQLVSAFEQRATAYPEVGGAVRPPPMPVQHPDWTDSTRLWRERRQQAAQTASSPSPPAIQHRLPQPPQPQPIAPRQTTHSQSQTMSVTTTTTSTNLGTKVVTTGMQQPQRPAQIQARKSMPQMRGLQHHYNGGTSTTTTTTTMMYDGAGVGKRASYIRGPAPVTNVMTTRRFYQGMDFGDVPVRVI